MKVLLTIFIASAFVLGGQAQGSLQFNQVILLESGSGVQTVPAGKVWKVTNVTSYSQTLTSSRPIFIVVNSNNTFLAFRSQDGNGREVNVTGPVLPMWLPAAATVEVPSNSSTGVRSISIVEFNVVP